MKLSIRDNPEGIIVQKVEECPQKVSLPKSLNGKPVIRIDDNAFESSPIQHLVIESDTILIGDNAFKDSALISIKANKINRIGKDAFKNTPLKVIDVDSIMNVGESAFENCNVEPTEVLKKIKSFSGDPFNMKDKLVISGEPKVLLETFCKDFNYIYLHTGEWVKAQ